MNKSIALLGEYTPAFMPHTDTNAAIEHFNFVPGSQVAAIYGSLPAKEHYYCNFGVNPNYSDELKQGSLNISGSDAEGEIRVIEHPGHSFFIGTLFVPQARSTPEQPHPLVTAFLGTTVG